jgi:hypothetical protein
MVTPTKNNFGVVLKLFSKKMRIRYEYLNESIVLCQFVYIYIGSLHTIGRCYTR